MKFRLSTSTLRKLDNDKVFGGMAVSKDPDTTVSSPTTITRTLITRCP